MFWISLIGVNMLFFIVGFILNIKNQPNPFAFLFERPKSFKSYIKDIYSRDSSDPFRLLLEYTILVLVLKLVGATNHGMIVLLACTATAGFIISTYSAVMLYIFNRAPVIQSDLEFIKVGMTIAYKIKFLILIGFGLLLVGLFNAFYALTNFILNLDVATISLAFGLVIVLCLGMYNVKNYGYQLFHQRSVYSFLIHSIRNYWNGNRYNFLLKKDKAFFEKYNVYKNLQLENRPNVVIFSIESYGSIVFKENELEKSISRVFEKYNQKLSEKGFSVCSGLSNPPLFGGGSWLSYTSFIFGMKVDDMNQYKLLFKNNSSFKYYQSLLSFLKSHGYKNYLLCPLGGGYNDKVDWEMVKMNFDADEFLDWDRMEYQGKKYRYLKMGYSPSDQYSIYKADEIIENASEEPYSLFFSTLNSHMPFHSPTKVEDRWQDLNESNDDRIIDEKSNSDLLSKYDDAINYQLSFVLDYIEKKNCDNTLYILFGDHQPPLITKKEMGFSTPIHVLSKNQDFLKVFSKMSFNQGFYPDQTNGSLINHEGFYSLFMKGFNHAFGKEKDIDLPYMPNGVQLG